MLDLPPYVSFHYNNADQNTRNSIIHEYLNYAGTFYLGALIIGLVIKLTTSVLKNWFSSVSGSLLNKW